MEEPLDVRGEVNNEDFCKAIGSDVLAILEKTSAFTRGLCSRTPGLQHTGGMNLIPLLKSPFVNYSVLHVNLLYSDL